MATQTLNPDFTWVQGGWVRTGGTSVHGVLLDADDNTYMRGPNNRTNQYLRVGVDNITLASNVRVRRVRVRYRGVVNTKQELRIRTYDTVQRAWSNTVHIQGALGSTTRDLASLWWYVAPRGEEWSKTLIDRQAIEFWDNSLGTVNQGPIVRKAWLEVETQARAVVSGVEVESTSGGVLAATTQPRILWAYSQAESFPEHRFEVAIFTHDQYESPNFDPSTSEAAHRTTEFGPAEGHLIEANLGNETLYRVYVRASQMFNGQEWWSDWASADFTIDLSPPSVPDLSATQDQSNYHNRLTVRAHLNMLPEDDAAQVATAGTWEGVGGLSGSPMRATSPEPPTEVPGGSSSSAGTVDFNRILALHQETGASAQLTNGQNPAGRIRYAIIHHNDYAMIPAIRAAHPGIKIGAYTNIGFCIEGPHTNGRPTTMVPYEDAVNHGVLTDSWFLTRPSINLTGTTSASPPVFTSASAHGYAVNDKVNIRNHSISAYNGHWKVNTVPTSTTFTLKHPLTGVVMTNSGAAGTTGLVEKVVTSSGFSYLMAMDIGKASYRAAMIASFAQKKLDDFDFVFIDDYNMWPGHGFAEGDPGVSVQYPTNASYRTAMVGAVPTIWNECNLRGLQNVVNMGIDPWDSGMFSGFTSSIPYFHGMHREFWTSWNSGGPLDLLGVNATSTWQLMLDAEAAGKFFLANTYPWGSGDHTRGIRLGLSAFWLNHNNAGSTNPPDSAFGYDDGKPVSLVGEYRKLLGLPLETKQLVGGQPTVYTRQFEAGIAVGNFNAAAGAVNITLPGGPYLDPSGNSVSSVSLDQGHGMILLRPTGETGVSGAILKVTAVGGDWLQFRTTETPWLAPDGVVPNERYEMSLWARGNTTTGRVRMRVIFLRAIGTEISILPASGGFVDFGTGAWTRGSVEVVAPAEATSVAAFVQISTQADGNPAAGTIFYVAGIQIAPKDSGDATPLPFVRGGLEDVTNYDVEYADAPYYGDIAAENIKTGGAHERSTNGFFARANNVVTLTNELESQRYMIRWLTQAGTAAILDVGMGSAVASAGIDSYAFVPVAGQPYEVKTLLRKRDAANTVQVQYRVRWLGGDGTEISNVITSAMSVTTTMTEYSTGSITAPAGTVRARVEISITQPAAGSEVVYIEGISFRRLSTAALERAEMPNPVNNPLAWSIHRRGNRIPVGLHQEIIVDDFEAPPNFTRLYRARAVAIVSNQEVASGYTPWRQTPPLLLPQQANGRTRWVVKDPLGPVGETVQPLAIEESWIDARRPVRIGRFSPRNSPYEVVVKNRPTSWVFTVTTTTLIEEEFAALMALFGSARTLLVVSPRQQYWVDVVGDLTMQRHLWDERDGVARRTGWSLVEVDTPSADS